MTKNSLRGPKMQAWFNRLPKKNWGYEKKPRKNERQGRGKAN